MGVCAEPEQVRYKEGKQVWFFIPIQWRQINKNGFLSMNRWILMHKLSADEKILHEAGAIRQPSLALYDINRQVVVPNNIAQYVSLHPDVSAHLLVAEQNHPFYLKRFFNAPENAMMVRDGAAVTCAGCGGDYRKNRHAVYCYINHPSANAFQMHRLLQEYMILPSGSGIFKKVAV